MTQATVNSGTTIDNPNAQPFSPSESNDGTSIAGFTASNDNSYTEYMDNEMGSYLRQHPPYIYPDNEQSQLSPEQLKEKLRKQLEYYFSRENMIHDVYLQSQMDADNYVPIAIIANFKLVKRLTHDLQLIIDTLKELPSVEVDIDEKKVRPSDSTILLPPRKRCIIILRNVPLDATQSEVSALFSNEHCSISAVEYERVLESDHSDCWYVTFNSEDDAQKAYLYLTQENVSIRSQKILARMKTRFWQKPSVPSNDNTASTSIPQNSSFIPLQQQQQQHYNPVYIQSIPTSHYVGNIPQQQQAANNFRHTQILQQQLPINYNNMNAPLKHAPWTASGHQQNVQPIFLYGTPGQQPNMSSYPISMHPQAQFFTSNHPVFPTNYWYMPPITDPYSTMTYNGTNKSKPRMTRDYQSKSKPRHSTKAFASQNSRHEELSINNDHSNELLDSFQNSSPHSEDSSPSVLRNETFINNNLNTSAQPIQSSNTSTINHNHSSDLNQDLSTNTNNEDHASVTNSEVASATYYNHTYADKLKLKQISEINDLPIGQLTLTNDSQKERRSDGKNYHNSN